MAIIVELEYLVRFTNPERKFPPITTSITVAWTARVLSSKDISLNGSRNTLLLQRGPGRSIRNNLVYGSDELAAYV